MDQRRRSSRESTLETEAEVKILMNIAIICVCVCVCVCVCAWHTKKHSSHFRKLQLNHWSNFGPTWTTSMMFLLPFTVAPHCRTKIQGVETGSQWRDRNFSFSFKIFQLCSEDKQKSWGLEHLEGE